MSGVAPRMHLHLVGCSDLSRHRPSCHRRWVVALAATPALRCLDDISKARNCRRLSQRGIGICFSTGVAKLFVKLRRPALCPDEFASRAWR